jgi:hypothetical protein
MPFYHPPVTAGCCFKHIIRPNFSGTAPLPPVDRVKPSIQILYYGTGASNAVLDVNSLECDRKMSSSHLRPLQNTGVEYLHHNEGLCLERLYDQAGYTHQYSGTIS